MIVRCWKEKKLAQMYCEILEEEEVAVIEEEPTHIEGEDIAEADKEPNYSEEKVQTKQDSTEIATIIEMKPEPEKFKANCCTVS